MQRLSLVLVAVSATALGGCLAEDGASDEGILIVKNVAPGDTCAFTSSDSEPFMPFGRINIDSPNAYVMIPQMKSRITATDMQVLQRTVFVNGSRVDLSFADPAVGSGVSSANLRFESLFSAPITPNGGITDGIVEVIPPAFLQELGAANPALDFETVVIVNLIAYGTMGGEEVVSNSFQYPVTVCRSCMGENAGVCPLPAGTDIEPTGHPCNRWQEGTRPCCMGANGLVCPPPVAP